MTPDNAGLINQTRTKELILSQRQKKLSWQSWVFVTVLERNWVVGKFGDWSRSVEVNWQLNKAFPQRGLASNLLLRRRLSLCPKGRGVAVTSGFRNRLPAVDVRPFFISGKGWQFEVLTSVVWRIKWKNFSKVLINIGKISYKKGACFIRLFLCYWSRPDLSGRYGSSRF